ncbi:homospermidine synthase [Acidimicrobiaceae bacterium]|nr:homospermidine synthase [Acidimicrobiaceae bacterium]
MEGVRVPDELPWRSILADARPYLGEIYSAPTDWDPLKTRNDLFPGYGNTGRLDMTDPWQFRNFLAPTPS